MSSSPTSASTDGRERFGRNVAFAWGGYMVNVIAGFVIPRLISDQLGQVTLGIWDFAWSFVSYFGLVQLGMGGSISRYVAQYRAKNDVTGLNRSVSTIAVFQRSVGWLSLAIAGGCALWVMPLFSARFGADLHDASWAVFFLGAEVALTTSLAVYGAVIVGCHRWDITNSVNAIAYAVSAGAMILVVITGGGLPFLALVHCLCMVGGEIARWHLSSWVCPELEIRRAYASWDTFREQARYSVKSMLPSIADLFSNQALSLLITAFLGPASLAIFSRARSLMTTLRTLAMKFGMIVVPSASAMQARNDRAALQETLVSKAAIISWLVLPAITGLAIVGDQVIQLWMGPEYVKSGLLPLLAVGTYATLVQEPVWSLLSGMNCHGRIALVNLCAGIVSAALLLMGLWLFHWGLLGAAVCFSLPRLAVDGIVTPWYACKILGIAKGEFIWRAHLQPLLCVSPLGVGMWIASRIYLEMPFPAVVILALGGGVMAICYIKWLVPPPFTKRMAGILKSPFVRGRAHDCL